MPIEIEITPKMRKTFASEVSGHLDNFEKMLLLLEKNPNNKEAIHSAFRAIHGIKGNSDYIGIKDINSLSHCMEDLLDEMRRGNLVFMKEYLPVLFEGLDLLRDMNRRITSKSYKESDVSSIFLKIERLRTTVQKQPPVPEEKLDKIDIASVFINLQFM